MVRHAWTLWVSLCLCRCPPPWGRRYEWRRSVWVPAKRGLPLWTPICRKKGVLNSLIFAIKFWKSEKKRNPNSNCCEYILKNDCFEFELKSICFKIRAFWFSRSSEIIYFTESYNSNCSTTIYLGWTWTILHNLHWLLIIKNHNDEGKQTLFEATLEEEYTFYIWNIDCDWPEQDKPRGRSLLSELASVVCICYLGPLIRGEREPLQLTWIQSEHGPEKGEATGVHVVLKEWPYFLELFTCFVVLSGTCKKNSWKESENILACWTFWWLLFKIFHLHLLEL